MVEKITAQKGRISPNLFYPDMTKEDYGYRGDWNGDLKKATGVMGALIDTNNLLIDDTPGISLAHVMAESRRIKRERGKVGMILADYLTLMTADKAERNDRLRADHQRPQDAGEGAGLRRGSPDSA